MNENPYEKYYGEPQINNAEAEDVAPVSQQTETDYTAFEDNTSDLYVNQHESQKDEDVFYTEPEINTTENISETADTNSFEWNGSGQVTNYTPPAYKPPVYYAPQQVPYSQPKRAKGTPIAVIILVCIIVSVLFGGGSAILVNHYLSDNTSSSSSSDNSFIPQYSTIDIAPDSELATTAIVDMTADSVVEIITEYVETGVFSQQYIKSGAGSGVIIDTEGYIVTNHHVIESAEKISVTLRNGENYAAELIGSDAKMDLALLKIEAENLTAAVFGNSDNLQVGQRTVAIGNPLGQLGGTVTEGIISALDRDVTVDGQTMNLLQTDTAINPGNSGGGLFDGNGNLIGIVVAKSSGSEVEGLGFAIPINDAVDVISDLIDYGYVRGRVTVGMEFIDIDSEPVAWMYGLSDLGCYVYSVDKGSNAEEAGFKSGDLILSVDGVEVDTSDDVEAQLDKKAVGDSVEFKVKRGRKTGTLTLVLEEYVPESGFGNSDDIFMEWGY